ncbi:MAG: MaoC family dehydratase [Actinobacteria bacterium]|nr:MaoC family dehydratase [Actinomycetota bacterium]
MPTEDFPSASEHVTQETINRYADISGDYNPIHVDEEAAAASEFGGTIAHGPIALQTFFRSLTEWLDSPAPPAGTVVNITFRAPTLPGDTIHSELRSQEGDEIAAECVNQDGTTVISAKATIPS